MQTRCWICGAEANSREHRIKASDLRSVFGVFDQRRPLVVKFADRRSIRVGSIDNLHLKFPKSICSGCNNARTQSADQAWGRLYSELGGDRFDQGLVELLLSDRPFMAEVHKFFMKHIGCLCTDKLSLPAVTREMSDCLMRDRNSRYLRLSFGIVLGSGHNVASISNVATFTNRDDEDDLIAVYKYTVGRVVTRLAYGRKVQPPGWNPSDPLAPRIQIASKFDERATASWPLVGTSISDLGLSSFHLSSEGEIVGVEGRVARFWTL